MSGTQLRMPTWKQSLRTPADVSIWKQRYQTTFSTGARSGKMLVASRGGGMFIGPKARSRYVVAAPRPSPYDESGMLSLSPRDPLEMAIDHCLTLPTGWNGYDAPPANALAAGLMSMVISASRRAGLTPTKVGPIADGGIGVLFDGGSRHADIETTNDGEVVLLMAENLGEPIIRTLSSGTESLAKAMGEIRAYLRREQ